MTQIFKISIFIICFAATQQSKTMQEAVHPTNPVKQNIFQLELNLVLHEAAKGGSVQTSNAEFNKCLLRAGVKNGKIGQIRALIEAGADINGLDHFSRTPLHAAACVGNISAIILLISDYKAEIEATDREDSTALHYAVIYGQINAIRTLITLGANKEAYGCYGKTPLHLAAQWGWVKAIETLVKEYAERIDSRTSNIMGITPLHTAAMHDQGDVITTLIMLGADVNTKALNSGGTPLHYAVMYGFNERVPNAINILIAHGALKDAQDEDGMTPLDVAIHQHKTDNILILLKNGVQVTESCISRATQAGDTDILQLLQNHRHASTRCMVCNMASKAVCGRCKSARYCSEMCQKNDWPTHVHNCQKINTNESKPV